MKIKGLYEFQSHIWLYFQDSKLERVFPHLGENSMAFGISWLGGIDKNFRLTWFGAVQVSDANARNCGENSG
jgi:hypothetical protein